MSENILARTRRVLADAFTLYLLPCSVALLPWPVGFALLKRVARSERLYREAVEPAWNAAREHCPGCDEKVWKYRFRLLRLVDHADVYLTLLRGSRWRKRYAVETGTWPAPGACLLLTYHWGAGTWIWPILRAHGLHAYFIAQRAQGRALGLTRLSHWFGRLRGWAMYRSGGAGALFTGGSSDRIAAAFAADRGVVGMLDVPVRSQQTAAQLPLLDGEARFPFGLVRLARDAQAAIVLFSFGLDFDNGHRELRVEALSNTLTPEQLMQRYVAHLDERLRAAPEAWQIWCEAPAIFVGAAERKYSETHNSR